MSEWFEYVPGVKTKKIGAEDGRGFYMMRMDPGATIARARHREEESLVVLEGAINVSMHMDLVWQQDEYRWWRTAMIPSGQYHEVRADYHEGALVLVVARPDFEVPDAQG